MWEELRRPATAISIGLFLLSVIAGVGTSFYFYKKSEKIGRVSYSIEQAQVVDRAKAGKLPLSVLDSSGKPVEGNIFAASIRIWNSGSAEIPKNDIREPLKFILPPDSRILDITPDSFTRNNVDKFAVDRDGIISWEHFDPNEGFRINVVYANPGTGLIKFNGYVVGLEDAIDYQERQQSDFGKRRVALYSTALFASLGVISAILIISTNRRVPFKMFVFYMAGWLLTIVDFVLWYYYPPQPPLPPI